MPENKNQHFVPKALLKPFTEECRGKSIDMLLLKFGEIREGVSVSDQCSKPYFYGTDPKLENAIQTQETYYGMARTAILDGSFPASDPDKRQFLKRFILFQHDRTLSNVLHGTDALKQLRKGLTRLPDAQLEPMPDRRTVTQYAMQAYVDNMPMLDDLSICFLRNRTKIDFVIGDHPAIHTNRWQLQRQKRSSFGPGHAGTIFLMPVSSRVSVMLYDGDIYAVGRAGLWLDIVKDADAEIINKLQFSNAKSAIYLSNVSDKTHLNRQFADFRSSWPQELRSNTLHVGELAEELDDFKKYTVLSDDQIPDGSELFVHVQQQHAEPPQWPSFMRYRSNPRFVDTKSGRGFIRRHTASWHHGSEWF